MNNDSEFEFETKHSFKRKSVKKSAPEEIHKKENKKEVLNSTKSFL